MICSKKTIAAPPGWTIKEQLEYRNMSQKEFSLRMGISEKHISKLLNGDVILTNDMARRLEMVLNIPADFWLRYEAVYRARIIQVKEENEIDEDIEIVKHMPYKEMIESGFVEKKYKNIDKVISLRKFFEVVRLTFLKNLNPNILCLNKEKNKNIDYVLLTYAQKAKLDAREIETSKIDIKGLNNNIDNIQSLINDSIDESYSNVSEFLSKYGIGLVLLPDIKVGNYDGFTFKDNKKIIIGIIKKDLNSFKYSLYHELGHIIYGHLDNETCSEEDEKKADEFATKYSKEDTCVQR